MQQSPLIYPANVTGETQNRQQIGTILQSMGFETDDIAKAFNIYEKAYGDRKYNVSALTEIVVQIQQQNENKIDNDNHNNHNNNNNNNNILPSPFQSHSAPNSAPNSVPNPIATNPIAQHSISTDYPQSNKILHQNPDFNHNNNNNNDNNSEMISIFNSLSMNKPSKPSKSMSASPQLRASQPILTQNKIASMNLKNILLRFSKYSSDQNEVIEVLLETLNNNKFVTDNMTNWNDLYQTILKRQNEWNLFQNSFNSSILYAEYNKNQNNPLLNTNNGDDNNENDNDVTLLHKSLTYKSTLNSIRLLSKKEKLLITANTYSILKNNKEKTEISINKYNNKIREINHTISQLEISKKQYLSALLRTKNKLLFQIQSIKDTENSIKELHEETNQIQNEINLIKNTKNNINTFENQLKSMQNILKYNFNKILEPNWMKWNNKEVIIWINNIKNNYFNNNKYKLFRKQIQKSNLNGKDLIQFNDFILRSFKLNEKNDRDILLNNIQRIIKLKQEPKLKPKPKAIPVILQKNKIKNKNKNKNNQCVVCTDGEANNIMIPCGHIAVCSNCVESVKKSKKCAFCGNQITNIIKCFHVGL